MRGVFRDPVVVEVDGSDGVRSVRGMAPGPAGAATMEVAEGVTVSVDFADPSVLCSIEVDGSARADALPVLLGGGRASQAIAASAGGAVVRVEGTARGGTGMTSLPTEQPAHELAIVTSMVSLAEDPLRVPLARVANAAEVLAAIGNGVRGLVDARVIRRRMEHVVADEGAVAHGDAAWLAEHERGLARRLADLLERVGVGGSESELVRILRATGGKRRSRRDTSHAAPIVEQHPGSVSATMTDGRGAWLRVADSSTMVLHALVPFVEEGTLWRADAVVAPDLPPEHVVVVITRDPAPTAATSLAGMRRAIALGRRAVEQAQVGRVDRAGEYWRECEQAWRALGDEARAARAADYAARRARPGRPRSLGERINTSIGREVPIPGT